MAHLMYLIASAEGEAHEAVREMPMPPVMFAVTAAIFFTLLFGLTWSFRNVNQKMGGKK